MARVISDSCISCGSCAAQCPVEAISQGDEHYVIDADACIDCGSCEAQCPVGAISEEASGSSEMTQVSPPGKGPGS